jgi:uncharacterized protein YkwD
MLKKCFVTAVSAAFVLGVALTETDGQQVRQPASCRGGACRLSAESPAWFLSALNAERSRLGRTPLAWDDHLARCAATNRGVHDPGSSGGAMQCWAGVRSYPAALSMWMASPAHRAILLGAREAVGASVCPSGLTCNAR